MRQEYKNPIKALKEISLYIYQQIKKYNLIVIQNNNRNLPFRGIILSYNIPICLYMTNKE